MDLMKDYYGKRADEYELIYNRSEPVRQSEIAEIKKELYSYFKGLNVLEAACGTGYWTETISQTAKSTVAFDYSAEVIEIAKSKGLNAEFLIDDAYRMDNIKGIFDGGCANFWFSHIPKEKINDFIKCFHKKLKPGARVFIADNVYLEGVGGELISKAGDKNTYKKRKLLDGSSYEIMKNYYSTDELKELIKDHARDIEIKSSECFWRIKYNTI